MLGQGCNVANNGSSLPSEYIHGHFWHMEKCVSSCMHKLPECKQREKLSHPLQIKKILFTFSSLPFFMSGSFCGSFVSILTSSTWSKLCNNSAARITFGKKWVIITEQCRSICKWGECLTAQTSTSSRLEVSDNICKSLFLTCLIFSWKVF